MKHFDSDLFKRQMAPLDSITLWGHTGGPYPWKVAMVIEELNIPYRIKFLELPEMKEPAIEDPNTGITLWESGAIIEYLVETYDKERKMSFAPGTTEYFHAKQWLHFQVSGQDPFSAHAISFKAYHPWQLQSAQDRYTNELRRVSSVLNRALKGHEWLVGYKYTYADVAFVMWFEFVSCITSEKIDILKEFPNLHSWLDKMKNRPAVAKVLKARADVNEKN
jgi:glutathione S-transferase